jgi:hypothetical protein
MRFSSKVIITNDPEVVNTVANKAATEILETVEITATTEILETTITETGAIKPLFL